jgi:hypothetical protein
MILAVADVEFELGRWLVIWRVLSLWMGELHEGERRLSLGIRQTRQMGVITC